VFLDEVESMPLSMQVKLLRALQQRCIERVGGNEPVRLSCRVVAATKDDLLALSRAGRFRMDLYYRINVVELGIPPLRERREDIRMLVAQFFHELSGDTSQGPPKSLVETLERPAMRPNAMASTTRGRSTSTSCAG
jgi:DNA-binding NtrC family response regulator